MRIWGAAVLVVAVIGCAGSAGARGDAERVPARLAGTLDVVVAADTAWLTLHVTNVSGGPLVLRFGSAQRVDFEVRRAAGEALWRWSDGRQFAQVLGEERLEAGGTRQWGAWWPAGESRGEYVAVGRLLALGEPLELSAGFEVRE